MRSTIWLVAADSDENEVTRARLQEHAIPILFTSTRLTNEMEFLFLFSLTHHTTLSISLSLTDFISFSLHFVSRCAILLPFSILYGADRVLGGVLMQFPLLPRLRRRRELFINEWREFARATNHIDSKISYRM